MWEVWSNGNSEKAYGEVKWTKVSKTVDILYIYFMPWLSRIGVKGKFVRRITRRIWSRNK